MRTPATSFRNGSTPGPGYGRAISGAARLVLAAFVAGLLTGGTSAAQERLDSAEVKRYKAELRVDLPAEQRIEVIQNVAFYQDVRATEILLDGLSNSLTLLERMEAERADVDEKMESILGPQIEAASPDNPLINFAGTEVFEGKLKELGAKITAEEGVVRHYRDALAGTKADKAILALLKVKAKKPERLRLTVLDALGAIDDGRVTERLIEILSEKDTAIQLAAAEALGRHSRERVPATAFGSLLNDDAWQVRQAAIDALGRLGGADAIAMLIDRMPLETGRELAEITARLEIMTGQQFGKTPMAWRDWWQKSGAEIQGGSVVLQRPVTVKGQGMEYWGIRVDSLRVLFVIDISATMGAALKDYEDYDPPPGEARLDLARREVKSAISALPTDSYFNMIAYSDIVLPWEDSMQEATVRTKEEAFEWLDQLVPVSATNIFDALEMAFQMARPGNNDRYYKRAGDTVLFLSDGGPTAGRTTDCDEIRAQVREWNRTAHLTIHVIGIGKQLNRPFLEKLAAENAGVSKFIE